MWNAMIIAVLAIGIAVSAFLINGLLTELDEIAWGVVTSLLTMLTFGFIEVIKTNVYLIKRQVGEGSSAAGASGSDVHPDHEDEIPF